MKTIALKKIAIVLPDGSAGVLDYAEQIRGIVSAPGEGQRGLSVDEIRNSMRVLDALDKAQDSELNLEDNDYNYMIGKVNAARFGFASADILQFVEDVNNPVRKD
jgi:hypothetical protein